MPPGPPCGTGEGAPSVAAGHGRAVRRRDTDSWRRPAGSTGFPLPTGCRTGKPGARWGNGVGEATTSTRRRRRAPCPGPKTCTVTPTPCVVSPRRPTRWSAVAWPEPGTSRRMSWRSRCGRGPGGPPVPRRIVRGDASPISANVSGTLVSSHDGGISLDEPVDVPAASAWARVCQRAGVTEPRVDRLPWPVAVGQVRARQAGADVELLGCARVCGLRGRVRPVRGAVWRFVPWGGVRHRLGLRGTPESMGLWSGGPMGRLRRFRGRTVPARCCPCRRACG